MLSSYKQFIRMLVKAGNQFLPLMIKAKNEKKTDFSEVLGIITIIVLIFETGPHAV